MAENPHAVQRVGVVGAGAWGTALATALVWAGRDVRLWAREPEVVADIKTLRENRSFLPDVTLPREIIPTNDFADLGDRDALLLVTPAQNTRAVSDVLAPHVPANVPVVICAKGIETASGELLTSVVADALPGRPLAVLSGPTFARETAEGKPTAVTLACSDPALGEALTAGLTTRLFRPYRSDDLIGAQLGGAIKNVVAIAAGVVVGRGLGENARAALITRGVAEMRRLGRALGAADVTVTGMSGLGDLTLTCHSMQSRNMSLGRAVGGGRPASEVLAERRSVAEGVDTARALAAMGDELGVELPICAAVDAVVNREADIDHVIDDLLARPVRDEA